MTRGASHLLKRRKAQKLLKTFEKRVNRNPYVTIKIK